MILALILGWILGFVSAVPIAGPISAVVFSRGMRGKYHEGRLIAWGAGVVEGVYCFLAFWSFDHLLAQVPSIDVISNVVASLILFVLSFYFYFSKKLRHPVDPEAHEPRIKRSLLLGAGMSAMNPTLIASWTLVATGLRSMQEFQFHLVTEILFSLGVTLGIVCWFVVLLWVLKKHRSQVREGAVDTILKGMGMALFVGAVWVAFRVVR